VRNEELAELLVRCRQSLWIVRAAACGADTCPAPDAATALRMIHTGVNALLELANELRDPSGRSHTPVPRPAIPSDRPSIDRLATKFLLELEELERNVAYIARDMAVTIEGDDAQRLANASTSIERSVSAVRLALEAALLALPPS
jgi:hypothetical protein